MLGSDVDFSKYMNKPECNVNIGDICKRTDYFICETEYRVDNIVEKDGKQYAVCSFKDEFTDEVCTEEIFIYYLERVR